MINSKTNNRIEPSDRINQFNGLTPAPNQSNNNEVSFICPCPYSHEKEHFISVNKITGKYQRWNNHCLQKNNPKEFTRLYLSGYYPTNEVNHKEVNTPTPKVENKSYIFNSEDKKLDGKVYKKGSTDSIEYAHFVWQKGHKTEFTKTYLI